MKLLTITVPCYNSQDYLDRCMESLLVGGEDVEILIVDDGSTDRTAEMADAYAQKYPAIVKVIHKQNGGICRQCRYCWCNRPVFQGGG
mgnify:CR=1 FL=1